VLWSCFFKSDPLLKLIRWNLLSYTSCFIWVLYLRRNSLLYRWLRTWVRSWDRLRAVRYLAQNLCLSIIESIITRHDPFRLLTSNILIQFFKLWFHFLSLSISVSCILLPQRSMIIACSSEKIIWFCTRLCLLLESSLVRSRLRLLIIVETLEQLFDLSCTLDHWVFALVFSVLRWISYSNSSCVVLDNLRTWDRSPVVHSLLCTDSSVHVYSHVLHSRRLLLLPVKKLNFDSLWIHHRLSVRLRVHVLSCRDHLISFYGWRYLFVLFYEVIEQLLNLSSISKSLLLLLSHQHLSFSFLWGGIRKRRLLVPWSFVCYFRFSIHLTLIHNLSKLLICMLLWNGCIMTQNLLSSVRNSYNWRLFSLM
jgi:hypothetical protein